MIELPVIRTGLSIGIINLESGVVQPDTSHPIFFKCISRIDCCTQMRIPASQHDIERITAQGYELDQIIRDLSPIILNPNSPHGHREKAYILKTKPFDGSCTFLEEKLCRIHQFKPFACRIYPFAMDFISDLQIRIVIHQDQLCHSIKAVQPHESNNAQILEELKELITDELLQRGYTVSNE